MKRYYVVISILVLTAKAFVTAQDTPTAETSTELTEKDQSVIQDRADTSNALSQKETAELQDKADTSSESTEKSTEVLQENIETTNSLMEKPESEAKKTKGNSKLNLSAAIDMQADKKMYDEFTSGGENRFDLPDIKGYRKLVDDFWLRAAIKMSFKSKFLESALALRFYPYWMMRRKNAGDYQSADLPYLDVVELNQAYIKAFKHYSNNRNFTSQLHFKIGRDGLLNSCSHLFGNYLDQPTGGYGASRYDNITGPFKNRKVFANQIEISEKLNVSDIFGGRISIMIGGNVNNEKWYSAPSPALYQQMDSKLSAGFSRMYLDLYFLNEHIHFGGGYRLYTTKRDSGGVTVESNYLNGDVTFDAVIVTDMKFYMEMGWQKIGMENRTGIVRPINAGITIPTGKVLDTLAIEFENVADIFIHGKCMRDPVGGRTDKLRAEAWGIVAEKCFAGRVSVAWGLYTANPTGDMKTSLRISSTFKN